MPSLIARPVDTWSEGELDFMLQATGNIPRQPDETLPEVQAQLTVIDLRHTR